MIRQNSSGNIPLRTRLLRWPYIAMASVLICWWFWWPIWFTVTGGRYIGFHPSVASYSSTVFEFRYGHATRFVDDPYNRMQWVLGGLPDSISVSNNQRMIVYNSPKAIIKSWGDAMDVMEDSLKHKGYMGVWDEETHFRVDWRGVIQTIYK